MPYSGPLSSYSVFGRTEAAYFRMINEQGGINGRKLNLISVDDGYSPPKTVEQVRRLVEQEGVAFLFQTLGTPTSAAVRQYCDDNKVPQVFVGGSGSMFSDPQHFPWTIGFIPSNLTDAHIFAEYILATKPGEDRRALSERRHRQRLSDGAKDMLGAEHAGMVVAVQRRELGAVRRPADRLSD